MRITSITIQNFRKLLECHIDISEQTTLFVGANNSGKTSAMDALAKFLANRSFVFNDITIAKRIDINRIGTKWVEADCQQPADLLDWDAIVPKMDIWLDVTSNEMHYVASIIPTLKWRGGKLGVRLLDYIDLLLLMTVNPGFAAQKMLPFALDKIKRARKMLDEHGHEATPIEVDGNCIFEHIPRMEKAGANIFVTGSSSVFCASLGLEQGLLQTRACLANR